MVRKTKIYPTKQHNNGKKVWGIRVDNSIKQRCVIVATLLNIRTNLFVSFIINQWFDNNISLMENEKTRKELVNLAKNYAIKCDHKPSGKVVAQSPDEDEIINLRTRWGVRDISIETKLRIKAMALDSNIPIGQFIDMMTAREWERSKNKPASSRTSKKLRKDVKTLFKRYRY